MKNLLLRNLLAAAAILACGTAGAQTFSAEKRVSSQAGPSINPVVAASGNNVYVAWSENFLSGGVYYGDIYFARSLDNGATFLPAVALTSTPTRNDILPVIAAGGSQVHVYWTDNVATGDIYYRRSADSGASFVAEVALTTPDGHYSRPASALVDSGGRVHFAYYDDRPPAGSYGQIYYQCSTNGGASYTAATNITQFDGVVDNESPRMAQGTDGTMYMLFRTTRAGIPQGGFPPFEQFMMRTSTPVANCTPNWLHPPQKVTRGLPEEFANSFGALLVPGANNALHAAYWSDKLGTNLVYRRGYPNGKGWETPVDLSQLGPNHPQWDGTGAEHSIFGIGEEASGKVHVVFGDNDHATEGFQSGRVYHRCSPDGGNTWKPKSFLNAQPNTAQPRGAVAGNTFHMVWMDWRDNNSGAEIWYRNATGCNSSFVLTDLGGDGKSDLLYRNTSTGQLYRIFMNGFTPINAGFAYTEGNLAWTVIQDADFTGDGVSDLLWRNSGTGQIYLQPYNSSGTPAGGAFIYTEGNAAWKIVGTPDFDGDGKADLVWWNSSTGQVYGTLFNGTAITTQGFIYTEPNTQWKIVAVGDFAGSGKRNQLLWRNSSTGQVYLMTVTVAGGVFSQTGQMVYTEANTAWKIIAAADFNGDGKSDILYRNDVDGRVFMLLMNGGAVLGGGIVYAEGNLAWKIVSTGDYNGDGKADLLYRNDATGQVYMILMNGTAILNAALVYNEPNLAWKLLGPLEYAQ